ncbi:hypothetical protein NPIL_175481 [Nephila pilipes]|uniref:Uncharacterized protein n=1 Tax=Nephila pilipes TaxID=299642 RepID=A0A8X6QJR7_NEPPI|nr:hypothetical protein NPIL_175481 [Nephila pilipes]
MHCLAGMKERAGRLGTPEGSQEPNSMVLGGQSQESEICVTVAINIIRRWVACVVCVAIWALFGAPNMRFIKLPSHLVSH